MAQDNPEYAVNADMNADGKLDESDTWTPLTFVADNFSVEDDKIIYTELDGNKLEIAEIQDEDEFEITAANDAYNTASFIVSRTNDAAEGEDPIYTYTFKASAA